MSNSTKKVSVSFAEKTLEYIDFQAEEIGVTRSAMIAFMVEQYRKQDETMSTLRELQELIEKEQK